MQTASDRRRSRREQICLQVGFLARRAEQLECTLALARLESSARAPHGRPIGEVHIGEGELPILSNKLLCERDRVATALTLVDADDDIREHLIFSCGL
jgi:hypothetical protein